MILFESKSIFDSTADALVNPVNCEGTMGKGLAKEFKKRFPECFQPYIEACSQKKLVPGEIILVRTCVEPDFFDLNRPAVILFPTKKHWRGKSKVEWIEAGLSKLKNSYKAWGLSSVAIPQIGCGLGGLDWGSVKPIITRLFNDEELELHVHI